MLVDSGEIISQSPDPQSVSGDQLYTLWEGYGSREFLQYMGQLQENKLVTEFATPTPL
jgi:hypothetical protein